MSESIYFSLFTVLHLQKLYFLWYKCHTDKKPGTSNVEAATVPEQTQSDQYFAHLLSLSDLNAFIETLWNSTYSL